MRKGEKMSEEQKEKISKSLIGHIVSEETRKKIGIKSKGFHPVMEFKKGNPPPKHREGCECFRCKPKSGKDCFFWKHGLHKERKKNNYYFKKRYALKIKAEGSHTKKEFEEMKKYYGNKCLCCGVKESEKKLTQDHIVSLSNGGSDYIENIQPLCLSCNIRKGNKHSTNYKEKINEI